MGGKYLRGLKIIINRGIMLKGCRKSRATISPRDHLYSDNVLLKEKI